MAKSIVSKWLEEGELLLIKGWKRNGLKDEEIAKNIGISIRTFERWKADNEVLSQTVKTSKQQANFMVENKLFKKEMDGNTTALRSLDTAGWQTDIYSSNSFFKEKVVDVDRLYKKQYLWIASYGVDSPRLDGVEIWQSNSEYSIDNQQVDMSYDFFERYTDGYSQTEDVPNNTNNNSNSWTDDFGDVWVVENGTFTLNTPINLRWGAKINSGLVGTLNVGDSVNYDAYSIHDGLVWIRQPRSDGYGYLLVKQVVDLEHLHGVHLNKKTPPKRCLACRKNGRPLGWFE